MGNKPLLSILLLGAALFSCGSPTASTSQNSQKGEEKVTTTEKDQFETLITNAGLITDIHSNMTLKIDVSTGEHDIIKIAYLSFEISQGFGSATPTPFKYYSVLNDRAEITLVNPNGAVLNWYTVTHDEAIKDLSDLVGFVGSAYVFDNFTYDATKGTYHADTVEANTPGFSMKDVNFQFENGSLMKVSANLVANDGSSSDSYSLEAYDYGKTEVKIPY